MRSHARSQRLHVHSDTDVRGRRDRLPHGCPMQEVASNIKGAGNIGSAVRDHVGLAEAGHDAVPFVERPYRHLTPHGRREPRTAPLAPIGS